MRIRSLRVGWRASSAALILLFSLSASGLCINAREAKLRSKPSSNAPITWTVGLFAPFIFIEQQGSWARVVDQDNQQHWVYVNLVTQDYRCVSVAKRLAEPRTGPGRDYPPVDMVKLDRYVGLKRLDKQGDWIQVQHQSGEKFWLSESDVWYPIKRANVSF